MEKKNYIKNKGLGRGLSSLLGNENKINSSFIENNNISNYKMIPI